MEFCIFYQRVYKQISHLQYECLYLKTFHVFHYVLVLCSMCSTMFYVFCFSIYLISVLGYMHLKGFENSSSSFIEQRPSMNWLVAWYLYALINFFRDKILNMHRLNKIDQHIFPKRIMIVLFEYHISESKITLLYWERNYLDNIFLRNVSVALLPSPLEVIYIYIYIYIYISVKDSWDSKYHWFKKMSPWIININLTFMQKAVKVYIYIHIHIDR